jgi:hypothetical protein
MTPPDQIRLRDLYLASYLLAQGVTYLKTEWVDRKQAEFVFAPEDRDEHDRAEQLRRAWVNQTAECEAVKFASCIKMLKGEVHSSERETVGPMVEHRRASKY